MAFVTVFPAKRGEGRGANVDTVSNAEMPGRAAAEHAVLSGQAAPLCVLDGLHSDVWMDNRLSTRRGMSTP
jgi:hypothetical protein